jgi:hypothetical protein
MQLSDILGQLEILVPIAKAVPVFGAPVEGSLEAAIRILRYATVGHPFEESMVTADIDHKDRKSM